MRNIIIGWLLIGAGFVLPPVGYAYANNHDVVFTAAAYSLLYVLFWAVAYAVIRGVRSK